MKRNASTVAVAPDLPAYQPNRARKLFRAIRAQLDSLQDREIPYEELARYAGQAASSVFDKLQRTAQPQVEALLGWLERLPEPTRNELVNSACRAYPTIGSHRLAHDPTQVSHLKTLLGKRCGLTIVHGGNDGLRTFVVTALGHSHEVLEPDRGICGLDVHEPDWFVPLSSVIYLHNLQEPTRLKEYVYANWAAVSKGRDRLVVLNGVWSAVQHLDAEFRELGLRAHVVVADDSWLKPELLVRGVRAPAHVVKVSEEKEGRIQVVIQQI